MTEAKVPLSHKRAKINLTLKQQRNFWRRVDSSLGNDSCWPWISSKSPSGYGKYTGGSTDLRTHRVAYALAYGELPDSKNGIPLCVCHKCDNPACCNPMHLFLGTNRDNTIDMIKKGRKNTPSGDNHYAKKKPEKLARGERHGMTRLTWDDVRKIRASYASGCVTQDSLAIEFGVCRPAITNIINKKTWKE
jgi:hypothetical protein